MAKRRRATLRGKWWQSYFKSIRFCYMCGYRLKTQFVLDENKDRLVCQKCKTITYLNPKVVAGLIPITSHRHVVLLKRNIEPAKGWWSYPAGFQELGETIEEAAIRETQEEIGARVKITRLVGLYSYPDAGVVTIVYEGRLLAREIPVPTPEASEVKIYSPSTIPWRRLAFRSTLHAMQDWKKLRR